MKVEVPMIELSLDKVCDLLGTRNLPGSDKELKKLCTRIRELVELNGKDWVMENRQKLLDEWEYIVRQGLMT
jgi:uncharacterized protein with von Willebrand factor type A (vWA) domain